jgi:hypothetical protein
MIASHIHHALAQVQELQQKILEKQRFKGYSGRARALCGTLALAAGFLMSARFYPHTIAAHEAGWGAVFAFSLLMNFGAVLYWFLFDPASKREVRRLKPVVDVFPPLMVGGILTLVLLHEGLLQYLFGTWMCLFGLANLATRHVLPRAVWLIGLYYLLTGTVMLLLVHVSFLNPWPMAITFFIGEWCGGIILHFDEGERFSWTEFLGRGRKKHVEI